MRRHANYAETFAIVICLLTAGAFAQQSGTTTTTTSRAPSIRTVPRTTNTNPPIVQQPYFYAGKVMIDTGIVPPSPVAIVRTCGGVSRRETYTATDGSFSFMVGDRYSEVLPDASDDMRTINNQSQFGRFPTGPGMQNSPQGPISDCELRADLAGYSSTVIHLDPSLNNSQIGIIMLHSRAKRADGMVTVASLAVPSKARHEFEKGSEQLEKGKLDDAQKSLHKAIEEYPKFAEAWTRLGDLEQRRKDPVAAEKDYQQAIEVDPNLPLPYFRLAFLSAINGHWDDTRRLTDKLISLDPTDFPIAYYYNAVAEYNLKNLPRAESSALRAEALDKEHSEPRIQLLLANIYVAREKFNAAAEHYRAYLALVPDGPVSERVKTDLAKMEQLAKSQAPTDAPKPTADK